ncbi:hypothetical protein [Streptacidiphilus sp. MAP5-3]|uniref:hypothetical protein n=1 Tax=unclassified Streptacidiphilus TaxID=2643834 RepID=UPI0035154CEA
MIEGVTRCSAGQEITDRILRPLGLAHTTLPLTDPRIHGRHLHGYDLTHHDVTLFDLGRDLRHQPPAPASDALGPTQTAVFYG